MDIQRRVEKERRPDKTCWNTNETKRVSCVKLKRAMALEQQMEKELELSEKKLLAQHDEDEIKIDPNFGVKNGKKQKRDGFRSGKTESF